MIDVNKIKKDFPIFKNNPNLVYFDSAATSLKPQVVIDKIVEYYEKFSANIHRGIYALSERATEEYEKTRQFTADFIGAKDSSEIIFTRNTTESINLISYSLGRQIVKKTDEIVVTIMEHHSNFVPWQQLSKELNADFKVIDVNEEGCLIDIGKTINKKTKILALSYVSNVLGTINPIKEIIKKAKRINPNIVIIIDAAQSVPYMKVNVSDLDCDFLAFSAHKMLGPTGVGVLWGKKELLDKMFPFNLGGGMIEKVSLKKTTFRETPYKFEAGTPHIAGVIAFYEAIKYLLNKEMKNIKNHEQKLAFYTIKRLKEEFDDNIKIYGQKLPDNRSGLISFTFRN
ncbi:MAG: selenocysteine lyase, partial [uncultured bacterium]